jgi:Spy/CpxP family protein refolding chaperone
MRITSTFVIAAAALITVGTMSVTPSDGSRPPIGMSSKSLIEQ